MHIFNILIDFVSLLTIFLTCLRALLSMFPFTFSGLYGGYMVISFKTYIFSPCHVTSSILKWNVHSVTDKNQAAIQICMILFVSSVSTKIILTFCIWLEKVFVLLEKLLFWRPLLVSFSFQLVHVNDFPTKINKFKH